MSAIKMELTDFLRFIQETHSFDLHILARFIKSLRIDRGHDAIIAAWTEKALESAPWDDWGVVESVLEQEPVMLDDFLPYKDLIDAFPELSERECQMVFWIARGADTKKIAKDLDLSVATVKFYTKGTLKELGVSNRTEIAILAIQRCGLRPQRFAADQLPKLSQKEQQLAREIVQGKTYPAIATTLSLSLSTVKTRVRRLLLKFNVRSRLQIAIIAYLSGDSRFDVREQ